MNLVDDLEPPLHTSAPGDPFPGVVRHAPVSVDADRDFEDLYREHAERLWRAVFAYSGDGEMASDAVSEAFAQCLARRSAVRSPGRWVWKAAFRIAAGELKERRMRSVPLQDQPVDMDPPAAEFVSLLAGLSPRQRACLVLRYYGGYRPAEIGGILGSTAATVRVHLSQGRRRLRRSLREEDA
jgi:RNA polymerase sigma factor (sigma-70 family)